MVPLTLFTLMMFTLEKGKRVLSFTIIPETFFIVGFSCAKTTVVSNKNKKATIYFIIQFDGLKVVNLLKYIVASVNNYKKINNYKGY